MSNLDQVIIVDLDDKYISKMDKYKAHEHPAKLHQAVSVWLINNNGQVLLQKRSSAKIVGATWWANAICGNVRPTEIYSACARRRLKEEINIMDVEIKPVYKFVYKAYCNEKYGEYEFDQVYVGKYNDNVIPNFKEASEVAWVNLDDLVRQVNIGIGASLASNSSSTLIPPMSLASPEQTLVMSLEQLKQGTAPCEVDIFGKSGVGEDNKKQLLAPWTCMMLKDERLLQALKVL